MTEDFSFEIGGILSEEESKQLFEEQPETVEEKQEPENDEQKVKPTEEEPEETQDTPEKVGEEEPEIEENTIVPKSDGTSPNLLSSIAKALKKDGVLPDFEDSELEACNTPEAFAELFEKASNKLVDEKTRRVNELLDDGANPSEVKGFEKTIEYLNSIDDEALNAEGEEGDQVRKELIFNDLINKGYSEEKAQKMMSKFFEAGSDKEEAKDALDALKKHYQGEYDKFQENIRKQAESAKAEQKKTADQFKKMILEDELKLGDTVLDKKTCQMVYDSVMKPVYKDPKSGKLLTKVQQFQKENPLEFLKQLGMWFILTEEGKNITGFTKRQVQKEKNKGIRELAQQINSSNLNEDGTLRYTGGIGNDENLLSDGWKVGWEE